MTTLAHPVKLTPPPFIRAMGIFLGIFNILAIALAVWVLALNRRHFHEQARIQTMNLAEMLEGNLVGITRQANQVLLSLKDEWEHDPSGRRLDYLMEVELHRGDLFRTIQIADAQGRITHPVPAAPAASGVGNEAFFQQLKQSPRAGLVISRPFRDAPGNPWSLTFALRLEGRNDQFQGVVFGHFPLEHLTRVLAQVDIGRFGSVSLRAADHSLLARYPGSPGQDALIGDQFLPGAYLAAVSTDRTSAQFSERSGLDGQRKTYTMLKIDGPGFFLFVGLGETDYLKPWLRQVAFAITVLLALLSLTLVVAWQARSAWIRHLADQERLAASESKYRLLAENVTNVVWALDPDGRMTYVSPSISRQRGWTSEEFLTLSQGSRSFSGEYEATVKARVDFARSLPPGSQPFEHEPLEFDAACKDGREIKVEAQWRVVWGEGGSLRGFQGVTRDITERKRLEDERERLFQDLSRTLAEVKTLSGLLPICSQCKKVRDDGGYWNKIEAYLSSHTDATFTHGLCPECAQEFRQQIKARPKPED